MADASRLTDLRHRRMVPKVTDQNMVNVLHTDSPETVENSPQGVTMANNNVKGDRILLDKKEMDLHPLSELPETSLVSGGDFRDHSATQPLLSDNMSESEIDGSSPGETSFKIHKPDDDSAWQIALQVFFPYIVAGLGMVGAGVVLDIVQHWRVFIDVSEVFILVPALLGLKGNLEMTLASRLSTQANLGNIDSKKEQWQMIAGNMALTQAQAIVVGFFASIAAMIFGWIPEGKFNISHGLLLCASSVTTAALASFVLGSIMVGVVIGSRKCSINPDNVATPIAASLGDLTTLVVLASVSSLLFDTLPNNEYVFAISSVGGLILDFAVSSFRGIAVFQPVINGVGGNLVAVQASRLSTALHQVSKPGTLPPGSVHGCPNLCSAFCDSTVSARTARVLMSLVIPGHLVFMYAIYYLQAGHTSITLSFAATYLAAAVLQNLQDMAYSAEKTLPIAWQDDEKLYSATAEIRTSDFSHSTTMMSSGGLAVKHSALGANGRRFEPPRLELIRWKQVVILLFIASWLVHWLWMRGNDPDNFSIPYLTAIGDLLGTVLLLAVFLLLYAVNDKSIDVTN
ncbi:hypothetical protein LSH36_18g03047 [Paralvinella palmiformis]|uniref:SLC41A/MgtE integral membrane domain-containing protein n=1 Tax=Paralvinella palmiformis TaxID=53620 RepID=A0AAD9KBT2_9ANNE|nr:hypothetical protein LSH36_18g03047 [Paralvinella palmiformis]